MARLQLRRLFRRHHGEFARLARELDLSPSTVSRWFQGHINSARIESAVFSRANVLLKKDAQRKAAEERTKRELASGTHCTAA